MENINIWNIYEIYILNDIFGKKNQLLFRITKKKSKLFFCETRVKLPRKGKFYKIYREAFVKGFLKKKRDP